MLYRSCIRWVGEWLSRFLTARQHRLFRYVPCRWVTLRMLDRARTARRSTTLPVDRQRRTGSASAAPLPSVHRPPSETGTGNTRWRHRPESRRVRLASWRTRCRPATSALVVYSAERCTQRLQRPTVRQNRSLDMYTGSDGQLTHFLSGVKQCSLTPTFHAQINQVSPLNLLALLQIRNILLRDITVRTGGSYHPHTPSV